MTPGGLPLLEGVGRGVRPANPSPLGGGGGVGGGKKIALPSSSSSSFVVLLFCTPFSKADSYEDVAHGVRRPRKFTFEP